MFSVSDAICSSVLDRTIQTALCPDQDCKADQRKGVVQPFGSADFLCKVGVLSCKEKHKNDNFAQRERQQPLSALHLL